MPVTQFLCNTCNIYIFTYVQNQSAASNDGLVNPDFSPPVQPPQQFVWPPPQWVAWLQQQQQQSPSPPQQGWSQTPTWPPPPMWPQHPPPPPPPPPSALWVVWTCMDSYELVWIWLELVVVDKRYLWLLNPLMDNIESLRCLFQMHAMIIVIYVNCLNYLEYHIRNKQKK